MVSVFDVVRYIVDVWGYEDKFLVQKLVYYCQAWSLVWDEDSLFREDIEAWVFGPIVRELFEYWQDRDYLDKGNGCLLNDVQRETVDSVLRFYGDKGVQYLCDLSRMEEPWKIAREGLLDSERGNSIIDLGDMRKYYSSL